MQTFVSIILNVKGKVNCDGTHVSVLDVSLSLSEFKSGTSRFDKGSAGSRKVNTWSKC